MSEPITGAEEWAITWYGLGGRPGSLELHRQLCAAYAEAQRTYHTLEHVEHCLAGLASHRGLATRPCEVAVALWFHDAVYDPRASDNEACSARWAEEALRAHEVAPDGVCRIRDMILATAHHGAAVEGDAALVVDLDLAILGQPPPVFDRYDAQIRIEFAWVDEVAYRTARAGALRSFLLRDTIYRCDPIRDRYETQARANLRRAIARLA